ncbi:hypothetical protein EGI22_23135 [Lacihabitans sp. LS3-19]|uniref:hypothetical protein n=1 Tax=Lacihabitans sp. LS3-19 TaxID=2487335 RepID=UPI0020CFB253|nr:hypothetical protein [Lacihabitans sp. LS3-19]MCP9770809.1 hypothetical protein [Lacihabitans sp. LS3-19]
MEILELSSKKHFKQFVNLPFEIHKNHSGWLPPILSDDEVFFDKNKNNQFSKSDTVLVLALKNNKPVGRIMGIVPTEYNLKHNLRDVRFNYLETFEDYEVVYELLKFVENWGRQKGCTSIVGPLGFSDKEPQGLEIEGFDNPPLILTNNNWPFMVGFLEKYGFKKKTDLLSYKIPVPEEYPDEYFQKYCLYREQHKNLKILNIKTRYGVWKYLKPAMNLINELFSEIYAHNPMSKKDINLLVKRFLFLLVPKYMKGILNEKKELIAFVIGMPDIAKGIQECNGRLFPLGFWKIFQSQRKTKDLILMLGGIKKEYRNIGLDFWLSLEIFNEIHKAGIITVKGHLVLESNVKTQAKMTKFGGEVNKRFRIFEKNIQV